MIIYNEFGITPTNTYVSAGTDFYIPIINESNVDKAYEAFKKTYKITSEELINIIKQFDLYYSYDKSMIDHIPNIVQLYLALYDKQLDNIIKLEHGLSIKVVDYFCKNFIVVDKVNNKVGIKMKLNDTLFINSGIKIALDTVLSEKTAPNPSDTVNKLRSLGIGVAGLYVNKSGKGNAGWDVRACLVDEDYSGFVHLSQSYTKDLIENGQNIVYCGDKLTQMILIPVFHSNYNEVDKETYDKIMENSNRGDKGFGSSDIIH